MGKWGASGEPLDDDARAQVGQEPTGTEEIPEGKGHLIESDQYGRPTATLGSERYASDRAYEPREGETREGGPRTVNELGEEVDGQRFGIGDERDADPNANTNPDHVVDEANDGIGDSTGTPAADTDPSGTAFGDHVEPTSGSDLDGENVGSGEPEQVDSGRNHGLDED